MKTAYILRWGAYGDILMMTPLLRALKEDGYHVTVNMTKRGLPILKNNPHVDKIVEYVDNTVPNDERLTEYWDGLAKGYDKFINLSGSIEENLLKVQGKEGWDWSKEKRHEACNRNYYDETLRLGGYGHITGRNAELYFSPLEERFAKAYRKKYRDRFMVLWSLSGSSFHKAYPYTEYVARAFMDKYPDAMFVTVGDALCEVLEWSHPRTKCYSGKWPLRKSMIMTKYADAVVATETGMANAAACFDTPKVILLSHSSEENLTKYWKNCYPLSADVDCYPCHKLHYDLHTCPLDEHAKSPVCMAKLKAKSVFDALEDIYFKWKEKRYGALGRGRRQDMVCGRERQQDVCTA